MDNELAIGPPHPMDTIGNARRIGTRGSRPPARLRSLSAFQEPGTWPVELCVVVPTYNERGNIDDLIAGIGRALPGIRWEMIVVDDDSPDGTADYVRAVHRHNPRVRIIQRIGRQGLASACVEGMLATSAPFLAVMDGDLQHDPMVLADMLEILRKGRTDIVAASRYTPGGSIGNWSAGRAKASFAATRLARALTPVDLADPMSGFFAIRREVIDRWAPRLSVIGFKILLDIVMTAGPGLRLQEVPLHFATRSRGSSKFSPGTAWDLTMLVADKLIGHVVPVRLIAFAAVGAVAMAVQLGAMAAVLSLTRIGIISAQAVAAMIMLVAIFAIDNTLAKRGRRRRGFRWFVGLTGFAMTSGIGLSASLAIAAAVLVHGGTWPIGAISGTMALLIWNYGAAARYSWSAS